VSDKVIPTEKAKVFTFYLTSLRTIWSSLLSGLCWQTEHSLHWDLSGGCHQCRDGLHNHHEGFNFNKVRKTLCCVHAFFNSLLPAEDWLLRVVQQRSPPRLRTWISLKAPRRKVPVVSMLSCGIWV
jgi:hypothetical protein